MWHANTKRQDAKKCVSKIYTWFYSRLKMALAIIIIKIIRLKAIAIAR